MICNCSSAPLINCHIPTDQLNQMKSAMKYVLEVSIHIWQRQKIADMSFAPCTGLSSQILQILVYFAYLASRSWSRHLRYAYFCDKPHFPALFFNVKSNWDEHQSC